METGPTTEQALLQHAERQTKALENMNRVLMFFFVLALIALVASLGGAFR